VQVSSGGSSSSSGAMNSGLPASAAPLGGVGIPGVKVKFCRYYAKDKTCFYGDECQFLHEDPSMASLSLHGGSTGAGGGGGSPVSLSLAGGAVTAGGYVLGGSPVSGAPANVPKKNDSLGPAGTALEGQLLSSKFALRPSVYCSVLLLLHGGFCLNRCRGFSLGLPLATKTTREIQHVTPQRAGSFQRKTNILEQISQKRLVNALCGFCWFQNG